MHQIHLIVSYDLVDCISEHCANANIEQFLRQKGAIPRPQYSMVPQSNNTDQTEVKTDADLMLQRTQNAKKAEGSKDVHAETFGHHKASISTHKQVEKRVKSLCTKLAESGESSVYMNSAPQFVKTLVLYFCETQKKIAIVCFNVVDELNNLNNKKAKSLFSGIAELRKLISKIAESTQDAYHFAQAFILPYWTSS